MKGLTALKKWGLKSFFAASLNGAVSKLERSFGKKYVVKRIYGRSMILDNEDPGISRGLILFGERELDHLYILDKYCKQYTTFFDIGANIGYYVLIEAALNNAEGKRILAIEPSPTNCELLRANVGLNKLTPVVEIIEGAVSKENGVKEFMLSRCSNLHTFEKGGSAARSLSGEKLNVKTFSVAQLAEDRFEPELLRMDIEGHEVSVLEGLIDDFGRIMNKPSIVFETHYNAYNEDNDVGSVIDRLADSGYTVRALSSSSEKGAQIISEMGYKEVCTIKSDGHIRKIYESVEMMDLRQLLTKTGGTRTVLLVNEKAGGKCGSDPEA